MSDEDKLYLDDKEAVELRLRETLKETLGFSGLDELAERLGVSEMDLGVIGGVGVVGKSGKAYDFVALVNAVLDRLDKKSGE